jgi:hypothetical protein
MTVKIADMIAELRDQQSIDNQTSISKLEAWEMRVSDLVAVNNEVHREQVKKLDTFATELKRQLNEANATTESEITRLGESIRDMKNTLRGDEKVVAIEDKRKENGK